MKRALPWLLAALLAVALAAVLLCSKEDAYRPALALVGDVANPLTVSRLDELGNMTTAEFNGQRYEAIALADLLALLQPQGQPQRIVFMAADGFCAEITVDDLSQSYIVYGGVSGWFAVNPLHPVSANARQLCRLVVVCEADADNSIIVSNNGTETAYTAGQLYAGITLEYPYPEGTAEKEHDGAILTSTVVTRRLCVSPTELGCPTGARLTLTTESGESILTNGAGYFQLDGNHINYICARPRQEAADVRRIEVK